MGPKNSSGVENVAVDDVAPPREARFELVAQLPRQDVATFPDGHEFGLLGRQRVVGP